MYREGSHYREQDADDLRKDRAVVLLESIVSKYGSDPLRIPEQEIVSFKKAAELLNGADDKKIKALISLVDTLPEPRQDQKAAA